MLIDSTVAGRICRITPSFFTRAMRALGVKPDKREGRGPGGTCFWGARHILALLLVPVLERLGCREDNAQDVARRVALGFRSDEAAEAHFESGRHYIMIVGAVAAPELLYLCGIQNAQREYAGALSQLGIQVLSVDVYELWEQIRATARTLTAQTEKTAE